uniref:Mutator family transposase n=1 Tax=Mycobacterium sp. (strain MCS) TaxID=164756 RepID=A0A5Q5BTE7_MYCSS
MYVAIGVTCAGERDILGLWAGDGGEVAKFWLSALWELPRAAAILMKLYRNATHGLGGIRRPL